MSKPIAGKQYTIQQGDSLSSIASVAYGDPQLWPRIFNANQSNLKSTDPNVVYPGEVINIPEISEITNLVQENIKDNVPNSGITLEIDGRIVPCISYKVLRTMDTASDAWTAKIDWIPGKDEFIDRVTAPYAYKPAKAYVNGKRMVTGTLFDSAHVLDASQSSKSLGGFSATINIVDSNIKPENYEQNNVSLKERAETLLSAYNLKVVVDSNVDSADEKFDRVVANPQDTIFTHLSKLASEKRVLISSTEKGNLLITKAKVDLPPVGIIEESFNGTPLEFSAKFEGRKRFSSWRVICQTPDKREKKVGVSKDVNVPIARFRNINATNSTAGNIEETANWIRSKEFVKAFTVPFPYPSHTAPNGEEWRENTTVIVKSRTLGIPEGFKFLIRSVEFITDEQGDRVTLSLVPPQVYTGEPIEEPWRQ